MLSLKQTASNCQDLKPNEVSTKLSGYQLDKVNINKISNILSLEQTASDWQDLKHNVGTYWSEYQP